jgi:hypothetical protein
VFTTKHYIQIFRFLKSESYLLNLHNLCVFQIPSEEYIMLCKEIRAFTVSHEAIVNDRFYILESCISCYIWHISGTERKGQVPDYQIFQTMKQYLYWPKFLQVIFCYWIYIWAAQQIRAVIRLDISFSCWLRGFRVPFYIVFESLQFLPWTMRSRLWIRSFRV